MAATHKRGDDLVFATKNGTAIDQRNALRWWHDLTSGPELAGAASMPAATPPRRSC